MIRRALSRCTYGVTPKLIATVEKKGWKNWIDEQLGLKADDTACDRRIKAIEYALTFSEKGKEKEKTFSLFQYYSTQAEIWRKLKEHKEPPRWLIDAGAVETTIVTWTKAIHSEHQIMELLVEFWHNHFNVSVQSEDYISASFPIYDREVIRKQALGNFRQFTEAVAKSPAMLLYLDNAFSKASGAYLPGVSASSNLAREFDGFPKAASIQNIGNYQLTEGIIAPTLIKSMSSGDPLMGNAALQTIETIEYLQSNLSNDQRKELERGLPGYPKDWSSRELSRSLQTVAQLIKMEAGVKMINVDYGGWDTHERQANVFPSLVEGLSQSISAFYNDIEDKKDKVTVLVMSEFGRRLRANKSGGTDHGHGNFMMAIGGNVNGGKMYGDWPGLHPKALDKRVDLDVTTDYRNVLSNILKKSMQFSDLNMVFPGFNGYNDMGFIK